jgi:hypothetical protein
MMKNIRDIIIILFIRKADRGVKYAVRENIRDKIYNEILEMISKENCCIYIWEELYKRCYDEEFINL